MAQYTPSSGDYVRPHRSPWGAFPTRSMSPLSTSLVIQSGRLLTLNLAGSTSYSAVIPVTTPNVFSIVGIAADSVPTALASSATTPQLISVWEANPMVEFKAVTKGGAQTSSIVGLRRSLVYDSTLTIHYVDLTASTATDWRVVVTGNLGAEGDSGGYVSFRFLNRTGDQINSTILSSSPVLAFFT